MFQTANTKKPQRVSLLQRGLKMYFSTKNYNRIKFTKTLYALTKASHKVVVALTHISLVP